MRLARIPSPLLLITDRSQARRPLVEIIEAALDAGCRWVSLREKDLDPEKRLALIHDILPPIRHYGAKLLVHADVNAAMIAAMIADGVHLPAGANVDEARDKLGDNAIIGLSCHTLEEVKQASRADYVTLGPIGKTMSKPGYEPQLGLEAFQMAANLGPAVLALGGVDETNVREIKRTGAAGIAVMGSVMRSEEPGKLVRKLLNEWNVAGEND